MPAAMHTFYLRNFYVRNLLAQGELEIAGLKIDLSAVKSRTYIVSAKNDHIVPWESAYKTTGLVSGATRFVLSNGGHIAGIVNPPGPKAWFMSNDDNPATGEAWAQGATRKAESWWVDWTAWAGEQAGPMVEPPKLGSQQAQGARRRTRRVRIRVTWRGRRKRGVDGHRSVTSRHRRYPRLNSRETVFQQAKCEWKPAGIPFRGN